MKVPSIVVAVITLAALCHTAVAAVNTIDAESRITDVTVYEDRAQVTRSVQVQLKTGENEVLFAHLPASVMEDSVRATGKGAVPVQITGLEMKRVYLKEAAEGKVRELKEKMQKLKDADAELSFRLEALTQQREFITSIRMGTTDKISKELLAAKPQPEEWDKVSTFIRRGMDENSGERLEVEVARRENKKEIDALKRELDQLAGGAKEEKSVIVSLESEKGGAFTLDLSYIYGGALWVPVYDARADREKNDVELTYKGAVVQSTGEDWNDVSLSLSTARPSVGGQPGELYPWYISLYPPHRQEMKMARAAAPTMLMEERVEQEGGDYGSGDRLDASVMTATAEKRGQAVLFKIAKRESVPSDGNPHMTTIAVENLKAGFSYTAVPKLNELAFLKARVTNDTSYPFLAGKINVFLGPDFIGSSFMENVATAEKYDLYLGPDEGIKIERVLAERKTDKTFGIRKRGRTALRYTIKVENLLKDSAELTVQDQVPVSRSPEITVTRTEVSPQPVEKPEKEMPGLLEWKLDVKPGEKRTIEFTVSVEYPLGEEPLGL